MLLEKDPVSGKFILRYDASAYKDSDCLQYTKLRIIDGYCGEGKDFKMEYGTAAHKALQLKYSGASIDEQLKIATQHFTQPDITVPETEWRNVGHLVSMLLGYDSHYKRFGETLKPVTVDNKPLLEMRFAYPFYNTPTVEVLLCGTIDMVADYAGHVRCIVDHKTTAAWNEQDYLKEYELSPQLMIYKYIYDILFKADVACCINGIFLKKTGLNSFKRSDPLIRYSQWQISQMLEHLTERVKKIVTTFDRFMNTGVDEFTRNFTCCHKHFNDYAVFPCMFSHACKCSNPDDAKTVLDTYYARKKYDPATHQL